MSFIFWRIKLHFGRTKGGFVAHFCGVCGAVKLHLKFFISFAAQSTFEL